MSRFASVVPEVTAAVLARIDIEMPDIRTAAWRDRDADAAHLECHLARLIELAEHDEPAAPEDLDSLAAYVRASARRGAPLTLMQRMIAASLGHALSELWARAVAEDVTAVLKLSVWTARHIMEAERLVVRVYSEELEQARGDPDRPDALVDRLLAGVTEPEEAPSDGPWLVVVLGDAGEPPPDVPARGLPRGALGATAVAEGFRHVLLPLGRRSRREVWRGLAAWARGDVGRVAAAFADTAVGIPEAAETARRVARCAAAVGMTEGLVGLRDMLLETVLTAPTDACELLVGLLDAVAEDARLMETLVVYLGCDLERTRTARALGLSRGGLARRLDRITHLSGYDPRTARGVQVLGAALAARALRDEGCG